MSAAVQTPQQREGATTIYERSRPGRRAFVAPDLDVPERPLDELLPARLRRDAPPELPEVSEPEIVRHYNRLSKRNFYRFLDRWGHRPDLLLHPDSDR